MQQTFVQRFAEASKNRKTKLADQFPHLQLTIEAPTTGNEDPVFTVAIPSENTELTASVEDNDDIRMSWVISGKWKGQSIDVDFTTGGTTKFARWMAGLDELILHIGLNPK